MTINLLKNALNEIGHTGLDILHGGDTTELRADLSDTASLLKTIGITTAVASAILAILVLSSSCWFLAPILLIPLVLGIEAAVVGDNIKDIANNCLSRGSLTFYSATHTPEETMDHVYKIATKGTMIMRCFY